MINHHNGLREFGKFRLDLEKRLLWLGGEPVPLPLKAVDLLCVLVASQGAVVSKEEIWHEVWNDAFIEETNLTHNIYLLRKAFKDLGEPDLIKTVPRRGYRFTGVVHEIPDSEIVLERHSLTRTLIELQSDPAPTEASRTLLSPQLSSKFLKRKVMIAGALVVAAAVISLSVWQWEKNSTETATVIRSIAVLPLRSFNAKNDDDDLRLRITDALITRLGSMKDIAVRPTNAVLPFINEDRNSEEIGVELRVDAVLDGRVQREGDRVRITLQLISVRDGKQLWSEQFDGQADRLLDLQDIVSAKVLSSLSSKALPETLAKSPTNNADAYEAYLKGRYFWSKRNEESLRKAIGYFQEAVALDPQFAEAYSGIADAQLLLYDQNIEVTPNIVSQAKETLHHALLLKPDSADALATLGSVQMSYDWDWKGAEDSLRRATGAAPNSAGAWTRYGMLLMRLRRFDESQAALEKAVTLDPLSLIGNADLGMVYFCRKDFTAADTQIRKTLAISYQFGFAHWLLSRSLWLQGRKAESIDEIFNALKLDGNDELADRLRDKVQGGTPEDGINLLLHEWRDNPEKTNPHNMAYLSTYVGDKQKSLDWLKRSLDEHHPWTTWISAAPEFEVLRGDPRFDEILTKMDLKDKG